MPAHDSEYRALQHRDIWRKVMEGQQGHRCMEARQHTIQGTQAYRDVKVRGIWGTDKQVMAWGGL